MGGQLSVPAGVQRKIAFQLPRRVPIPSDMGALGPQRPWIRPKSAVQLGTNVSDDLVDGERIGLPAGAETLGRRLSIARIALCTPVRGDRAAFALFLLIAGRDTPLLRTRAGLFVSASRGSSFGRAGQGFPGPRRDLLRPALFRARPVLAAAAFRGCRPRTAALAASAAFAGLGLGLDFTRILFRRSGRLLAVSLLAWRFDGCWSRSLAVPLFGGRLDQRPIDRYTPDQCKQRDRKPDCRQSKRAQIVSARCCRRLGVGPLRACDDLGRRHDAGRERCAWGRSGSRLRRRFRLSPG